MITPEAYEALQAEREVKHAAALAQGDGRSAAEFRTRARRSADLRAVAPPTWAIVQVKVRRTKADRHLAALSEAVAARVAEARATGAHVAVRALSKAAREAAKALGIDVPAWAAVPPRATYKPREPKAVRLKHTQAAGAVPCTIPPQLTAWRERTPGAIVQLSKRGVVLHVLFEQPRVFLSVDAAIAAVA